MKSVVRRTSCVTGCGETWASGCLKPAQVRAGRNAFTQVQLWQLWGFHKLPWQSWAHSDAWMHRCGVHTKQQGKVHGGLYTLQKRMAPVRSSPSGGMISCRFPWTFPRQICWCLWNMFISNFLNTFNPLPKVITTIVFEYFCYVWKSTFSFFSYDLCVSSVFSDCCCGLGADQADWCMSSGCIILLTMCRSF